jgi:uncharacterized surface protein with fasciclin (FAS1) repeats
MRKSLVASLLVGALTLAVAAPAAATGSSAQPPSIAAAVIGASSTNGPDRNPYDYDLLLKAVIATGLAGTLANPSANFTVFAPNDAAFVRTARDLGYQGWSEQGAWDFLAGALAGLNNGDPIPVLRNILLYHVVSGRLGPLQVVTSRSLTTQLGASTTQLGASFQVRFITLVDNDPEIPNPMLNLFALNQKTGNGVIHGITRVLIPVNLP